MFFFLELRVRDYIWGFENYVLFSQDPFLNHGGIQFQQYVFSLLTGLKKKLAEAAKLSAFRKLALWIRPITSHLHWVVKSSEPSTDVRLAKWKSLTNHMQNIHTHEDDAYPACEHGPVPAEFVAEDGTEMVRDYLNQSGYSASSRVL